MGWVRIALMLLGLVEGAWMTFDGTRALTIGDYVTRSSGTRAGELGPWSRVVSAVGIPPRSTAMKLIFVAFGITWLIVTAALGFRVNWALSAMLIAAIATLWYAPVGTIFGIAQILALIWLRRSS